MADGSSLHAPKVPEPPAAPPELRRDPVIGRWTIVSTERIKRPLDFPLASAAPDDAHCPFCPGREGETPPEIAAIRKPGSAAWTKRVFRSAAPVVAPDEELVRRGEGMFDMMSGYGVHEVIVDAPEHAASPATMPPEEIAELILLWRDRYLALKAESQIRCITLFANKGLASGATITHSHSQIIATPIIPRRLSEEIAQAYAYFQLKERCVFCDVIESDTAGSGGGAGERTVFANAEFVVVAPFSSRVPYEMWILPKEHASHFEEITALSAYPLAEALRASLASLNRLLQDPPYSFVLHTAPTKERGMVHYHWHIEIMPRLTNLAGFEWGTGFYINPVLPELAAVRLSAAYAQILA